MLDRGHQNFKKAYMGHDTKNAGKYCSTHFLMCVNFNPNEAD